MKSSSIETKREKVAEILLTARIQKGLTQDELADMVGFKAGTIERIEQCRFSPNADQLYALCDALRITIKLDDQEI
jgi:transcriptional regulator with XRE-family HTH domain